jgi:hypothetical protein
MLTAQSFADKLNKQLYSLSAFRIYFQGLFIKNLHAVFIVWQLSKKSIAGILPAHKNKVREQDAHDTMHKYQI